MAPHLQAASDAEDNRGMCPLGKFVSSAYQAVGSIDGRKLQVAKRENADQMTVAAAVCEPKLKRFAMIVIGKAWPAIWRISGYRPVSIGPTQKGEEI